MFLFCSSVRRASVRPEHCLRIVLKKILDGHCPVRAPGAVYNNTTLKDLFETVNTLTILDFIKEIGFYNRI